MKEPTITVAGHFGDKEVNRDEFIDIWKNYAVQLKRLPGNLAGFEWADKIVNETVELAGSEFDRILEEK